MDDFSKVQRGLGVARLCAERGRAEAGAWFPYLYLHGDVCLSDHCVNRPRPVKGAGMKKSLAAPSAAPASESAGAAAVDFDESAPPPQKKARHDEAGSK